MSKSKEAFELIPEGEVEEKGAKISPEEALGFFMEVEMTEMMIVDPGNASRLLALLVVVSRPPPIDYFHFALYEFSLVIQRNRDYSVREIIEGVNERAAEMGLPKIFHWEDYDDQNDT